eukprot:CAMPEP_0175327712 /NCGR_PEP_ID=MMETSP0093-20121207/75185_1 /TAXON_ID=311494 /ORGANISM="Alexandrium monilatum, Strain CCMP3105" /LENGTH=412 /DNA_ID=CAMNT_0016624747 /DNA_START=100 /DNA_END=1340 /DNA_ORIENTATION=+
MSAIVNERGEGSSEITFGTGQVAGDFFRDRLCIGDSICIDANFIAADRESAEPFQEIPFDGIMGLGFKDLSMGDGFNSQTASSPFTDGRRGQRGDLWGIQAGVPRLRHRLGSGEEGVLLAGGLCSGGCQVAVDTGTSMLAGPSELVDRLSNMLGAKDDCSNFDSLPKIGFQIGDQVLNLRPDDYMDRSASDCSFSLMALDVPPPKGPLFIFGDPFLRRFVTIFDRKGPRVGFAVAKQQDGSQVSAAELISQAGLPAGDPGQPPRGAENPFAVNLHLDSGMMAGADASADADSGDAGVSSTAAPVVTTSRPEVAEATEAVDGDAAAASTGSEAVASASATDAASAHWADVVKDPFRQPTPRTSTEAQASPGQASQDAAPGLDDDVARMRKLLGQDAVLLQSQQRLVSIKLRRG